MKNVRLTIIILFFLIAVFIFLGVRCFYLQYFRGGYYDGLCVSQQKRIPNNPKRGTIVDVRGRTVAVSDKVLVVFAEPRVIRDVEEVSRRIGPILEMDPEEISRLIEGSKNPGFVKLKSGVDISQAQEACGSHQGIGMMSEWRRHYPMGMFFSHVVGFTGRDGVGLSGVELGCNSQLAGSAGKDIFLSDIGRRPVRLSKIDSVCIDGDSVILTIDAAIQKFVREALFRQYSAYEAESAIAIVANPKTGAIMSMVSLGDFEPEEAYRTDPNILRNRCITDVFEPGSILKPIIAAIALDAGVVSESEKIYCEKGNYHGKGFGRITEYSNHAYGDLTVSEILVHSSNIGMAKIGQRLGRERLYNALKVWGFGSKTGIDLVGEVSGILRPLKSWTGYSETRIPFGQEICVTPMQLVQGFCILANGGHYIKPYVVKAVVNAQGEVEMNNSAVSPVGYVIKPEVARWVVGKALVDAVKEGTGQKASLADWVVFGKTGTAQIAYKDRKGYSPDDYIASFVCGAPASDPAIVVFVSISKPNRKLGKGYTGGTVAAPVAGEIIKKTLGYLNVH